MVCFWVEFFSERFQDIASSKILSWFLCYPKESFWKFLLCRVYKAMAQDEETVRALTSAALFLFSAETDVTVLVHSQGQVWKKDGMTSGGVGEDSGKCNWKIFTTSNLGAYQITEGICMPKTYMSNRVRKQHLILLFHKLVIIRATVSPATGPKVSP